jgi:hypothetical protein
MENNQIPGKGTQNSSGLNETRIRDDFDNPESSREYLNKRGESITNEKIISTPLNIPKTMGVPKGDFSNNISNNISKDISKKQVKEPENIPQKKSVILLFFLSMITFNIYSFFWFIRRVPEFNNLRTQAKVTKAWGIVGLILFILIISFSVTLNFIPGTEIAGSIDEIPTTSFILIILILIFSVNLIVVFLTLAFQFRRVLNQAIINKGTKSRISWFFTLLFNYFYLQYEINRIIDNKEETKRVGPWICFAILIFIFLLSVILGLVLSGTI